MLWDDAEKELVIELNKNKSSHIWKELGIDENENHFAIWVNKKIRSNLTWKLVLPKSDVIIVQTEWINTDFLSEHDYLITDKIIDKIEWIKRISGKGISVKKEGSKSYTITKMTPDTFNEVFWNYILWAWWSIYCKNTEEIKKNIAVVEWWKVQMNDFIKYFLEKWVIDKKNIGQEDYRNIKHYSLNKIKEQINNDKMIEWFIFKWEWSFEEPYCCSYLYQKGNINRDVIIDFSVTTWSWRSKWVFTIVIKPK